MTETPRIALLPVDERDARTEALLRSLRLNPDDGEHSDGSADSDDGDMNLFTTLARHPRLLKRWSAFGGLLLAGGTLAARDREVLILRTAVNVGADYEWGHHLVIGRDAGLTDDEMNSLASTTADNRPSATQLLVDAADELHADAVISDITWAKRVEVYDEQQLIEIPMVVGQYHLVGFTLNSLRIQREPGIECLPT